MPHQKSALTFGMVDSRPVFMDEREDSYFLLDPTAEAEFIAALDKGSHGQIGAELRQALGLGNGDAFPRLARCRLATGSLFDQVEDFTRANPLDLFSVAAALRASRRALKTKPIAAVLESLCSAPRVDMPPDNVERRNRAARFAAARRYAPSKPNCLPDSIALIRFLGPLAAGATLVFGVKLDPFAAHCWVQVADLLLNDRIEHVERFQPVRAVECSPVTR